MNDEVKVYVVKKSDRRGKRTNYYLRYRDPLTGKSVEQSARTTKHSDALKAAGKLQDELMTGRHSKPNKMGWAEFRLYYTLNAMPALAGTSVGTYDATLNVFQKHCNPQKLADVTTARVTAFVTALRTACLREATVARHLRHLKAAMRWAHKQGLLTTLPEFSMPKRVKGSKDMRGRPITTEEFERMLEATPKVVDNAAADSWKFYLRGLWLSGLRLSESLLLRWDNAPGAIVVDFSLRRPVFRIPSESQKSGRDTLLPMAPEFAMLLETVAESERRGRVFKLLDIDGSPLRSGRTAPGKIISAIGKHAGVIVDEREKRGKDDEGRPIKATAKKFASAHDLRRSFGFRWAMRVMPAVLKELMRHAEISTTMKYYVGTNAEATADALWTAVGKTDDSLTEV